MPDNSRISKVIELIENSDSLKSSVQTSAEKFADSLVPFSFGLSIATYLLTGNLTKAMSVLMVDYSCAIKLSTPICVISAMRESANHDIMVKGGRFLENYAFADTMVFDKTGTLTVSCPKLAKVISFGDQSEDEILRTAACLEEHFPHSVAKAIVRAAEERELCHEEKHADVEYVVAHGIATKIGGQRALIGSSHFIFEDEKIPITDEQIKRLKAEKTHYSMVYLAIGNVLEGALCIEDPIRENAAEVIERLKNQGLSDIMMITGDGENTAKSVCEKLGIERFHAGVLPEDKLNIVEELKAEGHKVVMVGDGINDSPALAAADVSIAMKDASDIAREVADITLLTSDLDKLIILRELSEKLFKRIYSNYRFIALFNSSLLLLGMVGALSPSASAILHNLSTMGICAKSMKSFLNGEEQ
jgi:heavy metal translocating P-type ATPase